MSVFAKTILGFYTAAGVPQTGLTPTITIWRVSTGTIVVNAAAMTAVGGGWYKYVWAAFDDSLEWAMRLDGGASLPQTDRYQAAAAECEDRQTIRVEVDSELTASHGAGSWTGASVLVVKQNYAYDRLADQLVGMLWLESGDGQIVTPTSVSVEIRDIDNTLLFTMTDAAPDASGFFKLVQSAPGLTTGRVFKAVATVVAPGLGSLTSGFGLFTVG